MPIDKTRDEWQEAKSCSATTHILKFLEKNDHLALGAEKITDYLCLEHPNSVPSTLKYEYDEDNKDPLVSYVGGLLERMEQHGRVHSRIVEMGRITDRYYTIGSNSGRPLYEMRDLKMEADQLDSQLQEDRDSIWNSENPDEKIKEIEGHIVEMGLNQEIIDDRTTKIQDMHGEAICELRERIEDIEHQLEDGE